MRVLFLILFLAGSVAMAHPKPSMVERVAVGFGIPAGLLLTLCERESGAREDERQVLRPMATHDGGQGSGACGMKMETARQIIGRRVTKVQLQDLVFTAVLAARYLTEVKWCGRWQQWETRVLCYRVGPEHRVLARVEKMPWYSMPEWWGTRKIFERWRKLHGRQG